MRQNTMSVLALGVAVLASGCATKAPTPEEEVAVWLSEAPRALALKVEAELPKPNLKWRDYKPLQRVGKGAATALGGAGMSIMAGCSGGGPLGCVVGVLLAPVGAVIGGVYGVASVESQDMYHPLAEAKGAPELYESVINPQEMASLLREAAAAASNGKRIRVPASAEEVQGEVTLAIRSIDLIGFPGEDPYVALRLEAWADVAVPDAKVWRWGEYRYDGRSRLVSEWSKHDAKLFREELCNGTSAIAAALVAQLHHSAPWGASAKVAAAREKRARTSGHARSIEISSGLEPHAGRWLESAPTDQ